MQTNRVKLLLVDDDQAIVRLLAKIIERSFENQIEVQSITSASEARDFLDRECVDILVTDLEMPGINGIELLRSARKKNSCTQVLLITGHSTREALLEALELGVTDYLLKPIDQEEFLELLRQAMQRQTRWRQALLGTWQKQNGQEVLP